MPPLRLQPIESAARGAYPTLTDLSIWEKNDFSFFGFPNPSGLYRLFVKFRLHGVEHFYEFSSVKQAIREFEVDRLINSVPALVQFLQEKTQ